MKRSVIARVPLVMMIASIAAGQKVAQRTPPPLDPNPANQPKPVQRQLSFTQRMKQLLARTGAAVDDSRGSTDMVVSIYPEPKGGKTTIVLVNDRRRNLLGFYVYNFGNLRDVKNKEEVYRSLLGTNDEISIGSFFVDGDDDIGYKYLVNSQAVMSSSAFEFVYFTMAAVTREKRPAIRKLLGLPPVNEEHPPEVKKAAEEKPPRKQ